MRPLRAGQRGAMERFRVGEGAGHPEQHLKLNLLVVGHLDWRELGPKVGKPVGRLVSVCSEHRTGSLEFTVSHQQLRD